MSVLHCRIYAERHAPRLLAPRPPLPFRPALSPGVVAGDKFFVSFGLEPAGHLQANLLGGKNRRQLFHPDKLQHHLVVEAPVVLVVDWLVANRYARPTEGGL